ncbi:RNA polymerase sigma factor [Chitinophaga filiformis]|uniref:RNA polymerase sigma-70 factor, ECF subfamily n=1 Tax=Chitinophaga filiformis TaxID=104663 RepID=A0A1G7RT80_CHIFI|nr:sigma-70 family RNA polymerase sigma factor [Chitinophaga filiformis]SDG13864.1 RNA polymerase sigma-70 factor, ECF subfamily [Chitinophaga filiformis]
MDNNNYIDQELLQLVADGDRQAYQYLFETYWNQVFGACLHLTKSPEQAKDLTQDIFLKIWDHRQKLPAVRNFDSYLYTIARNLVRDQLRTTIFRESNREFLQHYFSTKGISPQEILEEKQLSEKMKAAIGSLPPKLQQVFTLSQLEGLSHKEIAGRLKISPLSSKTYMVRALLILRKSLMKETGSLLILALLHLSRTFFYFF